MIDFIRQNWQYFVVSVSLISTIISLIILKVKKVPLKKVVKVISMIPQLVSNAESVFPLSGSGKNKNDLVKSWLNDLFIAYGIEKYIKFVDIDNIIEEVLKCPIKKEI